MLRSFYAALPSAARCPSCCHRAPLLRTGNCAPLVTRSHSDRRPLIRPVASHNLTAPPTCPTPNAFAALDPLPRSSHRLPPVFARRSLRPPPPIAHHRTTPPTHTNPHNHPPPPFAFAHRSAACAPPAFAWQLFSVFVSLTAFAQVHVWLAARSPTLFLFRRLFASLTPPLARFLQRPRPIYKPLRWSPAHERVTWSPRHCCPRRTL